MAETFYGPWSLQMVSKEADYLQRVTIRGSENSDGSFVYAPGATIAEIRGEEWTLEMEWSSDNGATWGVSAIRRTDEIDDADGLVTTLGADDNVPALRDYDFDDLVIGLKYVDPASNPPGAARNRLYDFTIPRDWLKPSPVPDDRHPVRPVRPVVRPI